MQQRITSVGMFLALSIVFASTVQGAESATQPTKVSRITIDRCIQQLTSASVPARVVALKQLGVYGAAAKRAVPSIIDTLNENRTDGSGIGFTKPISPAITDAALEALKRMGPAAHDAAPYVTPLLKDRNELLRRTEVLETLNAIGPAPDCTPVVMRVVGEEGKFTYTRRLAITLLGKIEPPAVEATDLLRDICEDPTDKLAKAEATTALNSILKRTTATHTKATAAEDDTVRTLRMELDASRETDERLSALDKIAELGKRGLPLVPTLMLTLNDKDIRVRHAALGALAGIGNSAIVAVPNLVAKFIVEKDQAERAYYCRTIAKIDPTGHRTMPLLQEALEDPFKARLAIEMLQELGTDETTTIAQKARQRWRIK